MKKIISFSLWGSELKYLEGAICNVELASKIYSDFVCRFYVDLCVPIGYKMKLLSHDNVDVVETGKFGSFKSMFNRFEFFFDKGVEIALVRDTDSRLSYREKEAVEEFLKSDKEIHTMIDHPYHNFSLMPGLSGFKRPCFSFFEDKLKQFKIEDYYGIDYRFFNQNFSLFQDKLLIHDSIFNRGKQFPTKRNGLEFCGKVFDENENTVLEHEDILKRFLNENR